MNEIFAQEDAYMLEHPQEYSMSVSIMNESLVPNVEFLSCIDYSVFLVFPIILL